MEYIFNRRPKAQVKFVLSSHNWYLCTLGSHIRSLKMPKIGFSPRLQDFIDVFHFWPHYAKAGQVRN